MMSWLQGLDPTVQDVLSAFGRALLVILPIFMLVPFMIWYERRLLSWMQDRVGPNRTGNITFSRKSKLVPGFLKGKKFKLFGLLQSIADGVKLFTKEDILPGHIDRFLFLIAPSISLFVSLSLAGTLPWGPFPKLTPVADVNIGLLYVMAISSLGAYGSVLAGYASNNKYSLMGGLRASAQLISYELAMGVALGCMVLVTGSLKMTDMVAQQSEPLWGVVPFLYNWNVFTPWGFIATIVFFVCMIAESNRPPFDLPEAENELVAGYHTEYSTKRWGLFMMAEYIAMFTFSMIFFTVFFGGYLLPIRIDNPSFKALEGYLAPLTMLGKGAFGLSLYIWLRATFPRLRYDQLMNLGWKFLLPLATGNLMIIASFLFAQKAYGNLAGAGVAAVGYILLIAIWLANRSKKSEVEKMETRTATMVSDTDTPTIVVGTRRKPAAPAPAPGGGE